MLILMGLGIFLFCVGIESAAWGSGSIWCTPGVIHSGELTHITLISIHYKASFLDEMKKLFTHDLRLFFTYDLKLFFSLSIGLQPLFVFLSIYELEGLFFDHDCFFHEKILVIGDVLFIFSLIVKKFFNDLTTDGMGFIHRRFNYSRP